MFKDVTDAALEAMRKALANDGSGANDFAILTMVLDEQRARLPKHTRGGDVIGDPNGKYPNGIQYGQTHDMDCPGCANTPFTASPRSETYWAS
jgi:hypothetical protein